MRTIVICGIILLALALNYGAVAYVDLTGSNGQTILNQLTGSANAVNLSTNTGLWNWGNIPMGYTLNQSDHLNPIRNLMTTILEDGIPAFNKASRTDACQESLTPSLEETGMLR
jgi:hypothetical protein